MKDKEASAPGLSDDFKADLKKLLDSVTGDCYIGKDPEEALAEKLRKALTRASAATVAEPSECKRCGGVGTFLGNADGYDDETCDTCCGTGKQQAEHSNKAFKVVTWRSATDREFATRDEALAYIRSNAPNDWHIEPNQAAQQQAEPRAKWEDPRVQQVYEILCRNDNAPVGEHWEGFQARLIVDELFGQQAEPGADGRAARWKENAKIPNGLGIVHDLWAAAQIKGPSDSITDSLERMNTILAAAQSGQRSDEWKQAIDDELVSIQMTADSFSNPKMAVAALLDWHVQTALDPAVSGDAQALIKQGQRGRQ